MTRLIDKQDNIIKDAKHLLKLLEAGDPTYILVDICSAWEKWEEVCTSNPKKQKFSISGFVISVFNGSNDSEESNLVCHIKKLRRQIGITAHNRLERIFINLDAVSQDFNIAHLCNMTKYILFFVEFISCAEQKMGFTMWVLNPPINKRPQILNFRYFHSKQVLSTLLDFLVSEFSTLTEE